MTANPIDEIKRIRHQLGAEANFEVNRIFIDLHEQKDRSNRTYIVADNKALNRSGDQRAKCMDDPPSPSS